MAQASDPVDSILAELKDSDVLRRECQWHNLRVLNIDAFRRRLTASGEYAAFLIRALIGDVEIKTGDISWDCKQIALTNACRESIGKLSNDEDRKIGADLVARASLLAAWGICQQEDFKDYFPSLDLGVPPLSTNGKPRGFLRFLSADFVRARLGDQKRDIKNYEDGGNSFVYYDFGWQGNNPPEDGRWVSHGWRMKSERSFLNNPSSQQNGGIQTFLGFPAFFSHEAANISVHFPCDNPSSQLSLGNVLDPEMTVLKTKGIDPYLSAKKDEFEGRKKSNEKILGSITSCIGVASYQGTSFVAERFNAGYGVFLTVDIEKHETTESSCLSEHTCRSAAKPICPHPATQAMRDVQHRIRFKTLQVLATNLASEREQKVKELAKYEQMYRLLKDPLDRLTNAIKESQIDAYQIGATLYAPVDVFFDAKRQIHELFEDGRSVEVNSGITITIRHQPSDYGDNDAIEVAKCALRRVLPGALADIDESAPGSFEKAIEHLHNISEDRNSSHRALSRSLGRLLNNGKKWDCCCKPKVLLSRIKKLFYTLHKPDETAYNLVWETLSSYLSTIQLVSNNLIFLQPIPLPDTNILIPAEKNPLATHGQLVDFIVHMVAQHVHFNEISDSEILRFSADGQFKVNSEYDWIPSDKVAQIERLINKLLDARQNGLKPDRHYGDLKQPFVTLIERIPQECLSDCTIKTYSSNKGMRICISCLRIEFCEKEFTISAFDRDATGGVV